MTRALGMDAQHRRTPRSTAARRLRSVAGRSSRAVAAIALLGQAAPAHAQHADADAGPHARVVVADAVARRLEKVVRADRRPVGVDADAWRRAAELYRRNHFAPLWLAGGRIDARADALVAAVAAADRHGLRRSDYPLDALTAAVAAVAPPSVAAPDALARADLLLTATLAAYAADLLTGRVGARAVEPAWHVDPRTGTVDSLIGITAHAPDLAEALRRLVPREPGYATLLAALGQYRSIAAAGGWPTVPGGPTLRRGDASARVLPLRARLRAEGYLGPAAPAGGEAGGRPGDSVYGGALAGAVARFQERHGLVVDSAVGPATRAALNVSAGDRVRQIAANMERYRWLPRDLGERHVVVNVPAFTLTAVDRGQRSLTMRVVVGSELAGRRTPIFSDSMSYVQFGPYWNVPRSIALGEIIPEARRDRAYLDRHGYEVVRGWGRDAPVVDPWALDDEALASPRYRLRQRPGPGNALGAVKFMFPNDFNVYLHDTPAQALFSRRVRAGSHGCVRVAEPAALAAFVLQDDPAWPPERVHAAIGAGERVRVRLARKLPVYLVYLTAFDRDGAVAFRDDLYGRDAALTRALGDGSETPGTLEVVAELRRVTGRQPLGAMPGPQAVHSADGVSP